MVIYSVQFSHSVTFNSLRPPGLQHARLFCPSPIPRACLNSFYRVCDSILISSCHSLLLLPSIFSQHQGFFQWVSTSHQVAKVLEPQLQHQSFNEYSGLISFRIDWFDLLAVQVTLKSLLQHHSSKALILWWSAFFMVQLSHPYMITFLHYPYWKNHSFDYTDLCQ